MPTAIAEVAAHSSVQEDAVTREKNTPNHYITKKKTCVNNGMKFKKCMVTSPCN